MPILSLFFKKSIDLQVKFNANIYTVDERRSVMNKYSILEVSRMLNMPASTLRYYESRGLLPNLQRDDSGYRSFTDADIELLQLISCLKKTRMPIKEIARYVKLVNEGDETISERYEMIKEREEAVYGQIEELQEALKVIQTKKESYEKDR